VEVKRVGVREFRDHAAEYLAGEEVLAVECDGEPIGYYMPIGKRRNAKAAAIEVKPKEGAAEAMRPLGQMVDEILEETGWTEDELSRLLDPKQPFPDLPDKSKITPPASSASGH